MIFDRHAKLPIDSGSVPFSTGTIVPHWTLPPGSEQGSAEHPTVTHTSVRPALSAHVLPVQLAVQLHCHGPTAIDETSPAKGMGIKSPTGRLRRAPGGTIECASEKGRLGTSRMGRAYRGVSFTRIATIWVPHKGK